MNTANSHWLSISHMAIYKEDSFIHDPYKVMEGYNSLTNTNDMPSGGKGDEELYAE